MCQLTPVDFGVIHRLSREHLDWRAHAPAENPQHDHVELLLLVGTQRAHRVEVADPFLCGHYAQLDEQAVVAGRCINEHLFGLHPPFRASQEHMSCHAPTTATVAHHDLEAPVFASTGAILVDQELVEALGVRVDRDAQRGCPLQEPVDLTPCRLILSARSRCLLAHFDCRRPERLTCH